MSDRKKSASWAPILTAATICTVTSTGCGSKATRMYATPTTPMVLMEPMTALVAVEDPFVSGRLVELGKVRINAGATIVPDYEWKALDVSTDPALVLP